MFYLSGYLELHRDEYVQRLRALGQLRSWDEWIAFFLLAITEQAQANARTARAVMELYERLKNRTLELTRSQYAVPLLDNLFQMPVFQSSHLTQQENMPSIPTVMQMLKVLREAGVLKVVREGGGRRAQVLALAELVNICEGKEVI